MRKNMKERRIELGLNHADVAKKAGISRAYYTNIENGNKTPSLRLALRIKRALETERDDIFLDFDVTEGNSKQPA